MTLETNSDLQNNFIQESVQDLISEGNRFGFPVLVRFSDNLAAQKNILDPSERVEFKKTFIKSYCKAIATQDLT
jgi:hypothetical protein